METTALLWFRGPGVLPQTVNCYPTSKWSGQAQNHPSHISRRRVLIQAKHYGCLYTAACNQTGNESLAAKCLIYGQSSSLCCCKVHKQPTRIILCLYNENFQLPYNCKACCSECYSKLLPAAYVQCGFSIHCSTWVLPSNQFRKKHITPITQSWTQHTHLCSSYFNHCLKSTKLLNPRSSVCSARHPTAKLWVISWPPPKLTNSHLK